MILAGYILNVKIDAIRECAHETRQKSGKFSGWNGMLHLPPERFVFEKGAQDENVGDDSQKQADPKYPDKKNDH
ncbi:MAG: hypothetical protein ACE5E7_15660 [Anaerolineae bacterium]